MQIQRDDIIIRKGIIHILDSHNGYLGLSNDLLDLGPDLMEFIRGHIFKILESDDTKKCQFDGSLSPVLSLWNRWMKRRMKALWKPAVYCRRVFLILCATV